MVAKKKVSIEGKVLNSTHLMSLASAAFTVFNCCDKDLHGSAVFNSVQQCRVPSLDESDGAAVKRRRLSKSGFCD